MNTKSMLLASFTVFCCWFTYGQSKIDGYSVGLKIGTESFDGIYVEGVDLNLTSSKLIYSLLYNYNRDIPVLQPNPREYYQQANFLFGTFHRTKSFRFEIQTGLGIFWGNRRTDLKEDGWITDTYHSKDFVTIGLPIKGSIK